MLNIEEILFARMNDSVKLPSKRQEDGGYDIYANFEEDYKIIYPHETIMIPTKLRSAFSDKYRIILAERGSTGSKGIAQRCGVIDSGYRGEWFVPLTNTGNKPIVIAKEHLASKIQNRFGEVIYYPYEKAICQALVEEVPVVEVKEISQDDLLNIESKRGTGKLGSSNK